MGHIGKVIAQFVTDLVKHALLYGRSRAASSKRKTEELADSVLDYGRMSLYIYPQQAVLVDVDELAFRLRETRRTVRKALRLLESQGQAQRSDLREVWRLQPHFTRNRIKPENRISDRSPFPT
jgi:hypothetical protein